MQGTAAGGATQLRVSCGIRFCNLEHGLGLYSIIIVVVLFIYDMCL